MRWSRSGGMAPDLQTHSNFPLNRACFLEGLCSRFPAARVIDTQTAVRLQPDDPTGLITCITLGWYESTQPFFFTQAILLRKCLVPVDEKGCSTASRRNAVN